ncbi:MAG: SDR family oxidoreductase [Pseudomonadota bacterium]
MTRRVLITGGAKRLGKIIAETCAADGWQPVIHYNASGTEAAEVAKHLGGVAVGQALEAPGASEALIAKAVKAAGGPLHALVNSASIFEYDTAQAMTEESLLKNFRINAMAPLLLAKHFAAQAEDGAVIVNMLDQKIANPNPDHFSYTVSKEALHGVTRNLAQAFAPEVRVVGVAPGYNLPSPGQSDEKFERLAPTVNILEKRLDPKDVAGAVLFAMTNKAITGQVLLASNGEHLKPAAGDIQLAD